MTVNWQDLRGCSYRWWPFQNGKQQDPTVQFPRMKALGFNLVRIPLGWTQTPPPWLSGSNDVAALASAADASGMNVVYSFYQDQGVLFPPEVMAVYPGGSSAGNTPYYLDSVTVNGVDLWTYQLENYWKPLIDAVDSHASTLAYVILNEPKVSSVSLQGLHTFMAQRIRALSSKVIEFSSYSHAPDPNAAPPASVGNLGFDAHRYNSPVYPTSTFASWASTATANGWKVMLGEFGPCSANVCTGITEAQAATFIDNYVRAAHANGWAAAYWTWDCQDAGFPPNDVAMLSGCTTGDPQPNNLAQLVASEFAKYYGGGGGPTPTTLTLKVTQV